MVLFASTLNFLNTLHVYNTPTLSPTITLPFPSHLYILLLAELQKIVLNLGL
jgi:hypothetical protein